MIRPLEMTVQPGRQIVRDFWANRRTGATFLMIILLWCLASSFIFWLVERDAWRLAQAQDKNVVPLTIGRAIYFTAMNVTTVGFGDVVPRTGFGEVLAVINALAGLVMFGFLVAAATAALQPGPADSGSMRIDNQSGEEPLPNDESADPADDLLDAVARLLSPSRGGSVHRDGMILEVEAKQERVGTTIHVIVSLDRERAAPESHS